MQKNPENIYYDVQIKNFEEEGHGVLPLRFQESLISPLIKNTGDYEMSIVRFEIDTNALPSWTADIQLDQPDVDLMIESITLEFGTSKVQQYLKWIPINKHITPPTEVKPLKETMGEYHYAYSFRHYIDLVNNAFKSATEIIKTENSLTDMIAPRMIWNDSDQTCSLLTQNSYFNENFTYYCKIYFNRPLYGKLSSFPADKNFNNSLGMIYNIKVNDDYSTKHVVLTVDSSDHLFVKTDQEYSTISNWSAMGSIVFTSNGIPIISNQNSQPLVYNKGSLSTMGAQQNYYSVISDMATSDMCYKPNLLYVPSAEYRFISLIGAQDLKEVDFQVYWRDKKGNLNQFELHSGGSASVKFYFRLKK
jgi:hypothetical protein